MLLNYLKKKALLFLMVGFGISDAYAQQNHTIPGSFSLIGEDNQAKKTFYVQSIESADMEKFRLRNEDVALHFQNGFECVLFSAKSLIVKGIDVNPNLYQEKFAPTYVLPVFTIQPSGQIVGEVSTFQKIPGSKSTK